MAQPTPHNAITQRLDLLTYQWMEFSTDERARLCRWLVQNDEVRMIEVFNEMEASEHGQTPDIFLYFTQTFENPEQYTEALSAELYRQVEQDREALAGEGIHIPLPTANSNGALLSPAGFLRQLQALAQGIEKLEGHMVAFLQPPPVSKPREWVAWLQRALREGIPEQVRLMVIDLAAAPEMDALTVEFPELVRTLEPELDMPAAMQQLAAMGDPADPGVQFRKLFVELSQHAGKADFPKMEPLAENAIGLARSEGWAHLEIAVQLLMASTRLSQKQYEKALEIYQSARVVAQSSYEKEDPAGGPLYIQTLFSTGTAHLTAKDYEAAAESYAAAVPVAEAHEDHFNRMEAWRMTGYCREQGGKRREAFEALHHALDAAENLEEQIRHNSTLPYIGQAMLRLMSRLSLDEQETAIRERMDRLAGPDWETQLKTKTLVS